MELKFKKAAKEAEIQEVFNYTIDAFSEAPGFNWTLEEIKQEIKGGWSLYAVYLQEEIIAALFLKEEGKALLTKHTALQVGHHGSGYSHQIKEFIEQKARDAKLKTIFNYCKIDDFRMYSLNEGHDYHKTEQNVGDDPLVVEWKKDLK